MIIFLILFYFLFPVLIIYSTQKSKFLNRIGAVVLAYGVGLLIGNMGVFPRASDGFKEILKDKSSIPTHDATQLFSQGLISQSDVVVNQIISIQDMLMTALLLLAIPLLLFSLDLKKWLKLAKEALLSLVLAMTSLLVAIFIGYYIYKDLIDESWKVSGMLVGLYTGGTPNLAAIQAALKINSNTFILTNTYDMMIGAFCLVFLMTVAQRIFNLFLPSFKLKHSKASSNIEVAHNEGIENYSGMFSRYGLNQLLKAFGMSSIIVAIVGGITHFVPENAQSLVGILSITTLGLLASNWNVINRIEKSFQLGMYFIIVFSLIIASMGDLYKMFDIEYLHLFSFVALVVLGSMAIHVFLSFLFKVDSDTTIITITALTYSPPFVPVVAGALKNKNLIISGLTVGILGYAIGNYLGIAIAYLLQ